MSSVVEILNFWFGKPEEEDYGKPRRDWFVKTSRFDQQVRSRSGGEASSHFLTLYQQAAAGELDSWQNSPQSCLALIILLDQVPRNIFRNDSQAFATDAKALAVAKHAVAKGYDQQLLPVQRWFIYLPFEHSENLADQRRCVQLFSSLKDDPHSADTINYADRHLKVIERFGRFPHRNQILGRENTPEEAQFLQQPGSSF